MCILVVTLDLLHNIANNLNLQQLVNGPGVLHDSASLESVTNLLWLFIEKKNAKKGCILSLSLSLSLSRSLSFSPLHRAS